MKYPKPERGNKTKTKADMTRFEALHKMGCYICTVLYGFGWRKPEIAHLDTGMGRRKDHKKTIPLCTYHHREGELSHHRNGKGFAVLFGTDELLLDRVNDVLEK